MGRGQPYPFGGCTQQWVRTQLHPEIGSGCLLHSAWGKAFHCLRSYKTSELTLLVRMVSWCLIFFGFFAVTRWPSPRRAGPIRFPGLDYLGSPPLLEVMVCLNSQSTESVGVFFQCCYFRLTLTSAELDYKHYCFTNAKQQCICSELS